MNQRKPLPAPDSLSFSEELLEWFNCSLLGFLLVILTALLFSMGCNSLPPPAAINVNERTPEVVAMAISVARDAWCAADVGWCPDIVEHGGADVYVTTWDGVGHFAGPGDDLQTAGWEGVAGNNTSWEIKVPPPFATESELPWVLVHEFGHWCIDGHTKDGIMAAAHADVPAPEVDETARSAWLRACPR